MKFKINKLKQGNQIKWLSKNVNTNNVSYETLLV